MRAILRFVKYILITITLASSQFAVAYLLPSPWNRINSIFIVLVLLLLMSETGLVIWLAFATHFFVELYAATPFGTILFSSTVGMLATFWLYQYFFTNKSWYTALAVSGMSLVFYRLLYVTLLLVLHGAGVVPTIPWGILGIRVLEEILSTVSITAFLAFLTIRRPATPAASLFFR